MTLLLGFAVVADAAFDILAGLVVRLVCSSAVDSRSRMERYQAVVQAIVGLKEARGSQREGFDARLSRSTGATSGSPIER